MVNATAPGTDGSERESISPEAVDAPRRASWAATCVPGWAGVTSHTHAGVAAMVRASGDDRIVAVALLHDVVEKGRIRPAEPLAGTPGWWSSWMC